MIPMRGKPARAIAAAIKAAPKPRETRPKRKPKLPGVRESAVVKDVLHYLTAQCHFLAWRQNAGSVPVGKSRVRLSPVGMPDVLAIVPLSCRERHGGPPSGPGLTAGRLYGVLFGFEVKRPGGGVLSEGQRQWGEKARGAGACVVTVRSCREVFDALREAGCDVPAPDPRLL